MDNGWLKDLETIVLPKIDDDKDGILLGEAQRVIKKLTEKTSVQE